MRTSFLGKALKNFNVALLYLVHDSHYALEISEVIQGLVADKLFSSDLLGVFVISQRNKMCMSEMPIRSPLYKFKLSH